jgi:gamma-tubulin complex component 2
MEVGRILNAVAASVRGLLKEYLLLIVQLETIQRQGLLSLQKLFYHVNPTLRTMRALLEIAFAIANPAPMRSGCQLVSLLERRLLERAGDPVSRALHTTLLRASLPSLLHQIREWIYKGTLKDDDSEFFVVQKSNRHHTSLMTSESWGDEIWERFEVNDHKVPPVFEEVKEKILDAGRNWDIMRTCGKKVGVGRREIELALEGGSGLVGSQVLVQTLGIAGWVEWKGSRNKLKAA